MANEKKSLRLDIKIRILHLIQGGYCDLNCIFDTLDVFNKMKYRVKIDFELIKNSIIFF